MQINNHPNVGSRESGEPHRRLWSTMKNYVIILLSAHAQIGVCRLTNSGQPYSGDDRQHLWYLYLKKKAKTAKLACRHRNWPLKIWYTPVLRKHGEQKVMLFSHSRETNLNHKLEEVHDLNLQVRNEINPELVIKGKTIRQLEYFLI